jgi:hypothetical protein
MALAIVSLSDLTDMKVVKSFLSCAGFDPDEIEMYSDCAVSVARSRRALNAGQNHLVDIATTVSEFKK